MKDPHVERLHYRAVVKEHVDFDNAPDLDEENDDFRMIVGKGQAIFEMKRHFASQNEAREVVERFLRKWDVFITLNLGPDVLKFEFDGAELIDLAPPENGKDVNFLASPICIGVTVHGSIKRSFSSYPTLPKQFLLSPDAETLYVRYMAYKQGRENITSMAYLCLTVIKTSAANNLEEAAKKYMVSSKVLSQLKRLSSEKGDRAQVRKVTNRTKYVPLTAKQTLWIDEVVKKLIVRAGEIAHDPTREFIILTNNDFPKLEP
ncbi:MAG: hypothetical protein ABSG91_21245 [Syntrophobacteraceae bacterium]|jgi:hypothetical protein